MSYVELVSLGGYSTGATGNPSALLNTGPNTTPAAGLTAAETKIVCQCSVPQSTFRDCGQIVFEGSGTNTVVTAANTFRFEFWIDTKPIVITAGAPSGSRLSAHDGVTVFAPTFAWTPATVDGFFYKFTLRARDSAVAAQSLRISILSELWLTTARDNGAYAVTQTVASTTTANWTDATNTVTQTDAFANYTFQAGDVYTVTSGTGATLGAYVVRARTSKDAITVETDIAAGDLANNDIVGTITRTGSNNSYQSAASTGTLVGSSTLFATAPRVWIALTVTASVTITGFTISTSIVYAQGVRWQGYLPDSGVMTTNGG